MSRPTDVERGARIARAIALDRMQPDLFEPGSDEVNDMWLSICGSAEQQLSESRWAYEVTARS